MGQKKKKCPMQVRFAFLWKMSVLPLNQVLEKIKTRFEIKLKKNIYYLVPQFGGGESGVSFRAQILLKNGIEECKHYFSQK